VLDCTWNDREAEIVLRNLRGQNEEQQRLRGYYLKLREEYRKALRPAQSAETERRPER